MFTLSQQTLEIIAKDTGMTVHELTTLDNEDMQKKIEKKIGKKLELKLIGVPK